MNTWETTQCRHHAEEKQWGMQSGTNDNGCCRGAKRANLFYLQQEFQEAIPVYSILRANFDFSEWATTETNISIQVQQQDQQNTLQISL